MNVESIRSVYLCCLHHTVHITSYVLEQFCLYSTCKYRLDSVMWRVEMVEISATPNNDCIHLLVVVFFDSSFDGQMYDVVK